MDCPTTSNNKSLYPGVAGHCIHLHLRMLPYSGILYHILQQINGTGHISFSLLLEQTGKFHVPDNTCRICEYTYSSPIETTGKIAIASFGTLK
ncbi:hypothetical protein NXS19_004021 [Fusarium pseudograminearum]|nr:hypothetical protein NXS19_004021 [Fusarium pseudograminearum]